MQNHYTWMILLQQVIREQLAKILIKNVVIGPQFTTENIQQIVFL